ncbi:MULTISPECIES: UpxY family transcription antiterminator [unclassified Lentimicrobium]|uniref:UpxY family transcription antiterminator n=1 Tax=unclassified Lentimicrobium TaxID=2677434 RepID=UPI001553BB1A|nr:MULTISPECIES: UpxY family transcription antiterminator [unclassified Lentimicrobium]NPD44025.1 UpxY family transcription antiterminator [Lentimicrobium sp. S6]NPD84061.1 UpxY family transcription antiterminator [Lentimicrobium sp. L6]
MISYQWYAIYTRSRGEKVTAKLLSDQGIEVYLPLQRKLRQWSDRKKWVEVPYINSYVFVKASEKEYYDILNTQGVVRYVTFNGKAASIPDVQIEAMKRVLSSDTHVTFSGHIFRKGEMVLIEKGALMGYQGEVVLDSDGKKKVMIRIGEIGISMMVQLELNDLKKIDS